jgi:hypothetical protein
VSSEFLIANSNPLNMGWWDIEIMWKATCLSLKLQKKTTTWFVPAIHVHFAAESM